MVVSSEADGAGGMASEECTARGAPAGTGGGALRARKDVQEQAQRIAATRIAERRDEEFIARTLPERPQFFGALSSDTKDKEGSNPSSRCAPKTYFPRCRESRIRLRSRKPEQCSYWMMIVPANPPLLKPSLCHRQAFVKCENAPEGEAAERDGRGEFRWSATSVFSEEEFPVKLAPALEISAQHELNLAGSSGADGTGVDGG
jgi:hypothetical protein